MYCSSCGSAVTRGLSYCNHCGAKLGPLEAKSASKPAELFPDSLIWAMVSVFVVGLGCNIGLIAVLKDMLNLDTKLIVGFSLLVFLLIIALEGVLVSLLLSRRKAAKKAETETVERSTKEFGEEQPRVLPAHMESVTEQTTRPFEPTYVERSAK
jgi:uncharacterized paraquat-inducible protein A